EEQEKNVNNEDDEMKSSFSSTAEYSWQQELYNDAKDQLTKVETALQEGIDNRDFIINHSNCKNEAYQEAKSSPLPIRLPGENTIVKDVAELVMGETEGVNSILPSSCCAGGCNFLCWRGSDVSVISAVLIVGVVSSFMIMHQCQRKGRGQMGECTQDI
ncbi:8461_t:CDS:1, partial [Paraglomus occultum]